MFGELLWVVRDNGLTRSDTGGTTVTTSSAISVVLAYYIDILINRFWLRTSHRMWDYVFCAVRNSGSIDYAVIHSDSASVVLRLYSG